MKTQVDHRVMDWLLEGDVSIQYQAHRDLLGADRPDLRSRIEHEGWGARLLSCRNPDGSWGRGFYQPKWTCSHYTLLDLEALSICPSNSLIRESVHGIVCSRKSPDGGVNPAKTIAESDICVNGMFLDYASYFGEPQEHLESVVDLVLCQQMGDGGFNCDRNRTGAKHSSLHSTLCVLEGIAEYERNGYGYRLDELRRVARESREFILEHRLFRSDHTGEIIHKDLLRLAYPPRWKYNVLRCLDYFQSVGMPWDDRMSDALEVLDSKRRPDGRWPLQAAHPGQVHFQMEESGKPSRWNTLLALRVCRAYGEDAAVIRH